MVAPPVGKTVVAPPVGKIVATTPVGKKIAAALLKILLYSTKDTPVTAKNMFV